MKSLKTLIKLHRRQMDELRRRMGELERQKNMMEYASAKLSEELTQEMHTALDYPEMGNFFGNYADRIKQRQDIIKKEILNLSGAMNKLADEISAGFSELKKYEIAFENAVKAQKEEATRKDQASMDEIGVNRFLRKDDNAAP